MTCNAVTKALFFGLAIIYCLQINGVQSNLDDDIQKTIEEENLTCDNYEEYCEANDYQTQDQDYEANSMGIEACMILYRPRVCKEEKNT